jgi:predicted GIY-YIG superfamily endonuclease
MGARRQQYRQAQVYAAFAGGGLPRVIAHYKHRAMAPVRWFQAARTHPIQSFAAVLFLYLWNTTGHFILAIALTAVLVPAGIALWFEYRRRRTGLTYKQAAQQIQMQKRIKSRWAKACIAGGITANKTANKGVTIPPLTKITADKGDVTARIYTGQYAIPSTDVAKNLVRIAETIGCREVTMRHNMGVIDLRFCYTNPLEKVVKPADIRVVQKGLVPFGVTDDGEAITLPVLNKDGESEFRSTLIGGISGSGKSSVLWAILAGLIAQGIPVRLRVSDAAGGVELWQLGKAMEQSLGTDLFRVYRYAENKAQTDAMIKEMLADMNARMATMRANEVRKHKPTVAEPLDLLIIDEMIIIKSLIKAGADSDLGQMLSVCRKAGFGVIGCTQLSEKITLGEVRELMPMRMAFRMNTRPQTITILGDDQADTGPAHTIPRDQQGVGYMYDQGTDSMRKFRAIRITDVQAKQIAMGVAPDGLEDYGKEPPEPEGLHALYRLNTKPARDGSRKRLYIGISNEPARRFDEHRKDKRWAKDVDWADATRNLAWYPTRADALAAEAEAIRDELPVHNKVHNQDNPARELEAVA